MMELTLLGIYLFLFLTGWMIIGSFRPNKCIRVSVSVEIENKVMLQGAENFNYWEHFSPDDLSGNNSEHDSKHDSEDDSSADDTSDDSENAIHKFW